MDRPAEILAAPPPPSATRPRPLSREEQAKREIGHTDISPPIKWLLLVILLGTILVEPVLQHVCEIRKYRLGQRDTPWPAAYDLWRTSPGIAREMRLAWNGRDGGWFGKVSAANSVLMGHMSRWENALKDESVLGGFVRPPTQEILCRLGAGNEKAYVGRDGWLFYRPEIEYLTHGPFLDPRRLARRLASGSETVAAPQPDPRRAIIDFANQLRSRGVELLVMPVPSKAMIHPEKLSARYDGHGQALQNASFEHFRGDLEAAGVSVFDASAVMLEGKQAGEPQFLKTDTHWTPATMQRCAGELANLIRTRLGPSPAAVGEMSTGQQTVAGLGDLAVMLRLPAGQTLYPPQTVTIRPVQRGAEMWRPDRSADVLLLGDSYANIYSLAAMGWGEGAGLAEHLSLALGRPLDVLIRNDSGAYATRQMLADELARGSDRLAGKKLVIWEFAVRELSEGDWRLIPMTLGEARPSVFVVPPAGTVLRITGTVVQASPAPRPGSVPYKDHIVAVHLRDVRGEGADGRDIRGEAYVLMWSMRDGVWTEAARYREGQALRLRIRPWADVAGQLDRINRSSIEELQLEEPCWGEVDR